MIGLTSLVARPFPLSKEDDPGGTPLLGRQAELDHSKLPVRQARQPEEPTPRYGEEMGLERRLGSIVKGNGYSAEEWLSGSSNHVTAHSHL